MWAGRLFPTRPHYGPPRNEPIVVKSHQSKGIVFESWDASHGALKFYPTDSSTSPIQKASAGLNPIITWSAEPQASIAALWFDLNPLTILL